MPASPSLESGSYAKHDDGIVTDAALPSMNARVQLFTSSSVVPSVAAAVAELPSKEVEVEFSLCDGGTGETMKVCVTVFELVMFRDGLSGALGPLIAVESSRAKRP